MADMEDNVLKRVLPHSMEAEQSVIGSMLMDREAIVVASEQITEEDFYNRQYGVLFAAICELNDAGSPVDAVTLQDKLRTKDVPPEVSSLEFIREIMDAPLTSANIRRYANIVAETSQRGDSQYLLHGKGNSGIHTGRHGKTCIPAGTEEIHGCVCAHSPGGHECHGQD